MDTQPWDAKISDRLSMTSSVRLREVSEALARTRRHHGSNYFGELIHAPGAPGHSSDSSSFNVMWNRKTDDPVSMAPQIRLFGGF